MYIFPEVAIDVERVVQKSCSLPVGSKSLKNTCDIVQFFSKVACWRPETLLKLTSFTGNFKGFCPHIYRTAANFRKAFWRTLFFAENFALTFSIFQIIYLRKFWEYFNSILTSHCTASVRHCLLFSLTLKKTRLTIYVYIWLPRNSSCALKHKQTWPEQAVYTNPDQASSLCLQAARTF